MPANGCAARAEEAARALVQDGGNRAVGLAADLATPGEAERVLASARAELGVLRGVAVTTGLGYRGQRGLPEATDAAAEYVTRRFGAGPIDALMQAHVIAIER